MGNTPSKKEKPVENNTKPKKPEVTKTPVSVDASNSANNTSSNQSPITNKPNVTTNNSGNSGSGSNSSNSTSNQSTSTSNHTSTSGTKPDTSSNTSKNTSNSKSTESDKSKRLEEFYEKYRDPEDPSVIGPDGIIKLCGDLNVQPEDIVVLVLAWRLNAKKMGYFTKKEFIDGLSKIGVDSLQKLQSHLPQFQKDLDDNNNFKDIYRFSFIYAKENEQTKTLDLESSCGMLDLVLGNRYPHTQKLQEFLKTQKSYRVLNMDQWLSILEFSKVINADCSNYDADGAWPVLLDEYSAYVTSSK